MSGIKPGSERVVIHSTTGIIKGFLERSPIHGVEDLLTQTERRLPDTLKIFDPESSDVRSIPLCEAKAVFFVRSFEGKGHHKDLKFYSNAPIVHGIWVQLEFKDGETIEGIVYNSVHHLIEPGFFLIPTDPNGNNSLVYVIKASLKQYRVLGVRQLQD